MEKEEIKKHLKQVFWDLHCDPEELYEVLSKQKNQTGYITVERIYLRLLESYSWYKLLEIVPFTQLPEMLSENIISRLRANALKERYKHVARILRKTTLSAAR
ncbi:hypothetical protein [Rhodoflexus sp.]